jgi:DNA uptake protein ComE-like DNA-binding protein
MWKDFFYFSKRERQGIVVLIVLIAGIFIGKFLFSPKTPQQKVVEENDSQVLVEHRFSTDTSRPFVRNSPTKNYPREEKRTYYVDKQKTQEKPVFQNNVPRQEKLQDGAIIELNAADTAELKKLPGVGSSFAKRIGGYRRLLGGYYRKEQLQEVYGMYEELYEKIVPHLKIDTALIEKIDVNTASLDKLRAHPYMNFYRAKVIVELRKKNGKIKDFEELEMFEEFSAEDLEKLKYYLKF